MLDRSTQFLYTNTEIAIASPILTRLECAIASIFYDRTTHPFTLIQ
ncbi:hypothetical protein [Nostoc sp. LPT]|nr:hypothetical protein [Nostoc sp. LPT]MBN4003901.1 hypothetical protein [Nostoc sp. LPT]